MVMTRKQYSAVAESLLNMRSRYARQLDAAKTPDEIVLANAKLSVCDDHVEALIRVFAADNTRFNVHAFRSAAGVKHQG